MSFVLLVVGLLATAIGAIVVGFGVPINEFSLGNTLIIAGTTAMMGGLIVVGLALAIRALNNVAQVLGGRPLPAAAHASAEAPEAAAAPAPPRPLPARTPNQMPARAEAPLPRPTPPVVEDAPDMPLAAPRPPSRPAPSAPGDEMPSWRPPRPLGEPAGKSEPPARRAAQTNYDAVWPADGRVPPPAALDMEPQRDLHAPTSGSEPAPRFEPVSVLKSGVVDGMAYTLYTDGSIEAELAQGVVRFGSIEELRNHLEKSSS
jgi:hypothetical protein